ncbi:hypothetical protein [Planktothricoides raciborskii]|uniref:Uncharacterized protein n=1 Tax=Planktothricoides raciborskii GIHE-MW2 TaxID=2792601 RepID=A0AAU8J983_9CYAN
MTILVGLQRFSIETRFLSPWFLWQEAIAQRSCERIAILFPEKRSRT